MNVLVIGSGGREHTLAWKIKQSPNCDDLFVAPGNAGTAEIATNLPIGVNDFEEIANAIKSNNIQLVVVGPEDPLVKGLRDYLESREDLPSGLGIVGPGQAGAQLEGSKHFSKSFMERHGIPTANAKTFARNQVEDAITYLKQSEPPFVLKADGLAAGKGVIITESVDSAVVAITEMLGEGKFGEASDKVLIEQYLDGIEMSTFVLTDGEGFVVLPEAKDYKRIGEGDQGPNTGGMGSVSPVPFADETFQKKVQERVILPTLDGLKSDGIPYTGFLFIGLMNVDGEPYVIEYNVRMGDPETQVVLPRIETDFLDLLVAAGSKTLKGKSIQVSPETAVTVVMASAGYPGSYEKGKPIIVDSQGEGSIVFHAGTQLEKEGLVTSGGRVLAVTGMGPNITAALESAYAGVSAISWEGHQFRRDIGQDLLSLS